MWTAWRAPVVPTIPNAAPHLQKHVQSYLKHKAAYVEHMTTVKVITHEGQIDQLELPDIVTALVWSPCGMYLAIAFFHNKCIVHSLQKSKKSVCIDIPSIPDSDYIDFVLYISWTLDTGLHVFTRNGFCVEINTARFELGSVRILSDVLLSTINIKNKRIAYGNAEKLLVVCEWPSLNVLWSRKWVCVISKLQWYSEQLLVYPHSLRTYGSLVMLQDKNIVQEEYLDGLIEDIEDNGAYITITTFSAKHGDMIYLLRDQHLHRKHYDDLRHSMKFWKCSVEDRDRIKLQRK